MGPWCLGCGVLICVVAIQGLAQSAGTSFDVASVKPNRSGTGGGIGFKPDGGFQARNTTLARLLGEAYAEAPEAYPASRALPRFRIIGGPSWLDRDRFDVEAKPHGTANAAQAHAMLRALLADRFRVLAHTETRQLPIYHLVRARADSRLGPRLRVSNVNCAAHRQAGTAAPGSELPVQQRPCVKSFGRSLSTAVGLTLSDFAETVLSLYVGRAVADRTGLTGPYDWTLEWTPDQLLPTVGGDTPVDPTGHPCSPLFRSSWA